jgi:hypothetical protein
MIFRFSCAQQQAREHISSATTKNRDLSNLIDSSPICPLRRQTPCECRFLT